MKELLFPDRNNVDLTYQWPRISIKPKKECRISGFSITCPLIKVKSPALGGKHHVLTINILKHVKSDNIEVHWNCQDTAKTPPSCLKRLDTLAKRSKHFRKTVTMLQRSNYHKIADKCAIYQCVYSAWLEHLCPCIAISLGFLCRPSRTWKSQKQL